MPRAGGAVAAAPNGGCRQGPPGASAAAIQSAIQSRRFHRANMQVVPSVSWQEIDGSPTQHARAQESMHRCVILDPTQPAGRRRFQSACLWCGSAGGLPPLWLCSRVPDRCLISAGPKKYGAAGLRTARGRHQASAMRCSKALTRNPNEGGWRPTHRLCPGPHRRGPRAA